MAIMDRHYYRSGPRSHNGVEAGQLILPYDAVMGRLFMCRERRTPHWKGIFGVENVVYRLSLNSGLRRPCPKFRRPGPHPPLAA